MEGPCTYALANTRVKCKHVSVPANALLLAVASWQLPVLQSQSFTTVPFYNFSFIFKIFSLFLYEQAYFNNNFANNESVVKLCYKLKDLIHMYKVAFLNSAYLSFYGFSTKTSYAN